MRALDAFVGRRPRPAADHRRRGDARPRAGRRGVLRARAGRPAPARPALDRVAGFDVVRDADGALAVLEDNLRTPSGIAFAVATRAAMAATLPEEVLAGVQPVDGVLDLLREALLAAVPEAAPDPADPHVVLLTDGAGTAHWEHEWLARALGIPLVRPDDLQPRGDRMLLRADGAPGRRGLPPHGRGPRRLRRRQAARAGAAQGHARGRQPVRHRRGRRQAHAGLRRGHGPLLPRRGAAAPLRAHVRPRARLRPARGARPLRGARGQAARRAAAGAAWSSIRTRSRRTSRRCVAR